MRLRLLAAVTVRPSLSFGLFTTSALLCGLLLCSCQSSTQPETNVTSAPVASPTPRELTPAEKKEHAEAQQRANIVAEKTKKAVALKAKREAAEKKRQAEIADRKQKRAGREEAARQAAVIRQQSIDDQAIARVRARLSKDYPDSYATQKMLLDGEIEAYNYMKTVPNDNVKERLERDYPTSFATQKMLYEGEMKAKGELGQ